MFLACNKVPGVGLALELGIAADRRFGDLRTSVCGLENCAAGSSLQPWAGPSFASVRHGWSMDHSLHNHFFNSNRPMVLSHSRRNSKREALELASSEAAG